MLFLCVFVVRIQIGAYPCWKSDSLARCVWPGRDGRCPSLGCPKPAPCSPISCSTGCTAWSGNIWPFSSGRMHPKPRPRPICAVTSTICKTPCPPARPTLPGFCAQPAPCNGIPKPPTGSMWPASRAWARHPNTWPRQLTSTPGTCSPIWTRRGWSMSGGGWPRYSWADFRR